MPSTRCGSGTVGRDRKSMTNAKSGTLDHGRWPSTLDFHAPGLSAPADANTANRGPPTPLAHNGRAGHREYFHCATTGPADRRIDIASPADIRAGPDRLRPEARDGPITADRRFGRMPSRHPVSHVAPFVTRGLLRERDYHAMHSSVHGRVRSGFRIVAQFRRRGRD